MLLCFITGIFAPFQIKGKQMIHQIVKLKNFGIFRDYKAAKDLNRFEQYNLFYGWNGSGKSTVAKMFYSISDRKIHADFLDGEFALSTLDSGEISNKNISSSNLNLRVFNKDFVDKNVNFEQSKTSSILILSEEKKEEMDKYKNCKVLHESKQKELLNSRKEYDKISEKLKKNQSKWASDIKKSFELIETTNSYYLNYDRTKLNHFIRDNRLKINNTSILSFEEIKNLKNEVNPVQKQNIVVEKVETLNLDLLEQDFMDLEKTIRTDIVSNQIDRLKNNPDINEWVKVGLEIHEKHKSECCEFCEQFIPKKRLEDLHSHFSQQYSDLMTALDANKGRLNEYYFLLAVRMPSPIEFYNELTLEFEALVAKYDKAKKLCEKKINEALELVDRKKANPFGKVFFNIENIGFAFNEYNLALLLLIDIINRHNGKNARFDEALKNAQKKLELHFASDILGSEGYEMAEIEVKSQQELSEKLGKEVSDLELDVKKFESQLINEAVGAHSFNKSLAKFIGRKDIELEFDRDSKGYKLIRSGKTGPANNLSEGEKTAIAFVYFISKIKENSNRIENTIIVVDDPISSFDSNHLFHSYSFMKMECEKAMQLFILTHNFQYFKLIRDWLLLKNKKTNYPEKKEIIRSRFYSIDSSIEENRVSIINNANKTLLDFNSEYHFIFYKLYLFKGLKTLDLEKAFLIANLSRKLLEGFLSFKFPKKRNDFSQLLEAGCSDAETKEKVYRFINKYSHNQQIEFLDTPVDNLLGEGENMVDEIFKIISSLDKPHFDEMEEVCKGLDAN